MSRLRALLSAILPPGLGASALDDLDRELWARRAARPASSHRGWYIREALRLAVHLRWHRLTLPFRRGARPDSTHVAHTPGPDRMDHFRQNLRFAVRRLTRSPGFAIAAVLTLALGVGANVAVFSVVDAVLLRPLPYREVDRLVVLWESLAERGGRSENVANPGNVRAWAEESMTLEALAATVAFDQPQLVTVEDEPREVSVRLTTPGFFDVLGVEAAVGRTFSPSAGDTEGAEVVLTDRYWRDAYGADPGVVGRAMSLSSGLTGTIVGVLPPDWILWGARSDFYASYALRGDQTNTGRFLNTIARLAPGATVEQTQEELSAIAAGLREAYPSFNAGADVTVVPLRAQALGEVDTLLWLLLASVGILLLIACANVSNLFLARATERRREMAVRSSLGASPRTLMGQLLVESGLVASIGTIVGVLVAHGATRFFATRLPGVFALPRVEGAAVDGRALAFALGVAVATALLFGLVPALQAADAKPGEALAAEGRGPGRATGRARSVLVVIEVALSMLLLVGAGLVGRSLTALLSQELGLRPEHVLTARITLATPPYRDPTSRVRLVESLARSVADLPGVEAAGAIPFLPLDGLGSATGYWPGDRPEPGPGQSDGTQVRSVTPGYFTAMGIRILAGRSFDDRDEAGAPSAVVINQALAEAAWPGEDPLGRPVVLDWSDPPRTATVVGVVENARLVEIESDPGPAAYYPVSQFADFGAYHLVVRSTRSHEELAGLVSDELRAIDPALALGDVRVMENIVDGATARPRLTAVLMSAFAVVAAALAAVGLYGVLSYAVTRRVREIGVRVALGARPAEVLGRVVAEGMLLVAAGLAVGLLGALLAARFLEGLLFQIRPTDPMSLGAAALFLASVALMACVLPAWRATGIDPAEALRSE